MKAYTLKEVAEAFAVSLMTVRRMVWSGEIAAFKVGQQYRVTEEELRRFIDEMTVEAEV